jgi:hypothetical protein
LLLGFEVNPLHNLVHLIVGVAGLALWRPARSTTVYGWLLAIGFGIVWLYGLAVASSNSAANVLAINRADNWLHLASALFGLLIALWTARQPVTTTTPTSRWFTPE